ncbi:hypothetical protein [Photobacterium leiognathi]|uniref:hypothetical protein n=1 Tax=Photobacterium leiognathi TaxID=553611 RepID=UPI0027385566|nr:hypothetical protein [Photobacterium leiognathi]
MKFLVTSRVEAIQLLRQEYKVEPVAAGYDKDKDLSVFYVKSRRVVMRPTGTQTANGSKQYLVTVEK